MSDISDVDFDINDIHDDVNFGINFGNNFEE